MSWALAFLNSVCYTFPVALTHIILYFQTTHTMVHRILRKHRHQSRPLPKQTPESQATQQMDYPETPQSPFNGSQASESSSSSEGSSSIAPQAPCRRICNSSNTTSQLPQPDRRAGSQSVPSGSPEQSPELSSWQAHHLDPQYPELSASSLQAPSSITPSIYAPGRSQQDSASLESRTYEQYVASQISNQYSLPSSNFEDWPTHNGDGSALASMDASGWQNVRESSIDIYDPGAEESNELLSGMGSWENPRVLGGASISYSCHRCDGMRYSLNRRSATDQCEGLTVNPSQIGNLVPMENSPARQDQATHSQEWWEIDYPSDPSALGIDQSLQPLSVRVVHGSFVEDANYTNIDAENSQNEGYPHDPGFYGNHHSRNPSALAPTSAPEPRNVASSIPSDLTPPFDRGVHSQPAPESSKRCQICNKPFSNNENRRRHMREQHREKFRYICQLTKDGSVCSAYVKDARNRRKHVDVVHPRESTDLPPTSTNRRSNDKTDEMLNGWFDKVRQ